MTAHLRRRIRRSTDVTDATQACCPHDQGWLRLTEAQGNAGWWACRRGCDEIRPNKPDHAAAYLAECRAAHRRAMARWPDWAATLPQATRDAYAAEERAAAPTAATAMPARALWPLQAPRVMGCPL